MVNRNDLVQIFYDEFVRQLHHGDIGKIEQISHGYGLRDIHIRGDLRLNEFADHVLPKLAQLFQVNKN